jgi:hypothetical protein
MVVIFIGWHMREPASVGIHHFKSVSSFLSFLLVFFPIYKFLNSHSPITFSYLKMSSIAAGNLFNVKGIVAVVTGGGTGRYHITFIEPV